MLEEAGFDSDFVEDSLLAEDVELLLSELLLVLLLDPAELEAYPSLYQPPPLRWKAGVDNIFSTPPVS